MAPFKNLEGNIEALESAGLLRRISRPINKDTEMMPLVRCQYRGLNEEDRTAWLFENVTDSRGRSYDIPVGVALLGATKEMYAFNFGCDSFDELPQLWDEALSHPIDPVTVSSSPVKDVVLTGDDLLGEGRGLDSLPVPISTPGFDPAPFFTSAFVVTRDPESGVYNIGTYRCHLQSPDFFGVHFSPYQDISKHHELAIERGEDLESAVIIGATPPISAVSVSKVPYLESEYAVAGGLAGEPMELVDCETVDIQVPANAEIVIEGTLTQERHPEGPFGEFTGYMGDMSHSPRFQISCITHRAEPIYQAFQGQMPPSESRVIQKIGNEKSILRYLQNSRIKDIRDVALHEESASMQFLVIQLDKMNDAEPWQAMRAASGYTPSEGRFTVAVDTDIDPHDLGSVIWAMSYRVQPHRDVEIIKNRLSPLDPVSAPPEATKEERDLRLDSAIHIDATRPWDYPPTSLPKREFMEHAVELWDELADDHEFPDIDLVKPWYGESLGNWSDAFDRAAMRATEGKYYETNLEELIASRLAGETDEDDAEYM